MLALSNEIVGGNNGHTDTEENNLFVQWAACSTYMKYVWIFVWSSTENLKTISLSFDRAKHTPSRPFLSISTDGMTAMQTVRRYQEQNFCSRFLSIFLVPSDDEEKKVKNR